MTMTLWLAFVGVALAASFSPGPGVLLAISTTTALGARRTAFSSAGNAVGVFLVSCVAMSSVGLLFQRSPLAFALLKYAGAGYLAWLGLKQWRQAGKALSTSVTEPASSAASSRYAVFRRGVLVACSNPKAILFFAAVFPHFMLPGPVQLGRFLLLSLTFVACTFVSHLSYVLLTACAGSRFLAGRGMARLQRGTGVMFVLLAGALLR